MRLYWDGLSHEPSHDLRLHYKFLNTHAVTSPSTEDPGISLATMRMTSDGYLLISSDGKTEPKELPNCSI